MKTNARTHDGFRVRRIAGMLRGAGCVGLLPCLLLTPPVAAEMIGPMPDGTALGGSRPRPALRAPSRIAYEDVSLVPEPAVPAGDRGAAVASPAEVELPAVALADTTDETPPAAALADAASGTAPEDVQAKTAPDVPEPAAQPAAADAASAAAAAVDANVRPDANDVESLREAIVAALKANPEIQIALARQDDARFGVHEAWSGYLPHVDMTMAIGGEYNVPAAAGSTTLQRAEGTVTLNQNLWDFGTTINDIKRARAAYRSAQWGTRERIEAISYDISSAYLTVLERTKLIALTESEIEANKKILNMVTIQEDLGLTSPADVSRAKTRLENLQAELFDRRSALEQAREAYRRLTFHLPGQVADLPPTNGKLPAHVEDAVAMIDDHSPRLAQAVQDRRSLERQRASQTGTFFPRIGLMAQGNWKDDVQGASGLNRDARAMVTVSYSFFNGGRDIALRNRLSARLREADYELDRRRREVEQDIRIDFNSLEFARQKISTIDAEIAAAEKTADLYRQQFREGRRSVFDLLDSQQVLHAARARRVSNYTALQLAEFRVLQKLGGLFDLVSDGEPLPQIVTPAPQSGD